MPQSPKSIQGSYPAAGGVCVICNNQAVPCRLLTLVVLGASVSPVPDQGLLHVLVGTQNISVAAQIVELSRTTPALSAA